MNKTMVPSLALSASGFMGYRGFGTLCVFGFDEPHEFNIALCFMLKSAARYASPTGA